MYSSAKPFSIQAVHNEITIRRNRDGIPTIIASGREDLCYGIGYAHAWDRLVQMELVRAIAQGRASEKFAGSEELIEIDKFMRRINFSHGLQAEVNNLNPEVKNELKAYCRGVNRVIKDRRRPFEFVMVGHHPEEWHIADIIITVKIMGFVGLAQSQGDMEKFLVQLVQHGIDEDRIRALFPYLTDKIDYDLIGEIKLDFHIVPENIWKKVIPDIHASNNWVISGRKTRSGHPLMGSDPHMEVNRLPALWYEMVWDVNGEKTMGITMPGVPVMVFGRNSKLAWSGTYAFVDMIDYFIEDVKDEKYRLDGEWIPFEKRIEVIRPKKKQPITLTFYENRHGVLEGTADKPGKYLTMAFTGRDNAASDLFNIVMRVDEIGNVREAQKRFRNIAMPCFNWCFADREGNIGYQLNGRMPKRAAGFSGLLPIPGWDSGNDWQGFEDPADFPTSYNPESGYFATANNDLNRFGKVHPINLCMAPYRIDRIKELLAGNDAVDPGFIKEMHYDLYSKQAERIMPLLRPLLPDSENGTILKQWDLRYDADSKGAMLFEAVYLNIIKEVFGKNGLGEEVIEYLLTETAIFTNFFGNFDDVLMDSESPWFQSVDRETQLKTAIEKGLNVEAIPYGETRKFDMLNIFLGGKMPGFMGFDEKDKILPGNRATIAQGQIFRFGGRTSTFAPSYRMIVEIEKDGLLTNLPGGPSGNRFSKWYKSDLDNYFQGR
ncbi:MAG: penicillin acylase family protein, partial [FCB group bacterium]|nr:penicillin acylase family protein [FCB group bacterium]